MTNLTLEHRFIIPDVAAVSARADGLDGRAVLAAATAGEKVSVAQALALLRDTEVSTDEIYSAAVGLLSARRPALHTFVPLYTANHCASDCKKCGMRRSNTAMVREFAGKRQIEDQLDILLHHEQVRGVGFLTGEYDDEYTRLANAFRIGWAIRTAIDMGFERVYFNIGSLTAAEIDVLSDWIEPDEPVTMCVFQETYDRGTYARFMGDADGAPKGDYDRRVSSFDRWLDAGHRWVNPGVLIGLHDVESELVSLVSHVRHLEARGAVVDISLPRLRPAMAASNRTRVTDEPYVRMMSVVALSCPDQRLVLTNREDREFRDRVIDLCGVISPGSPDVAPYRRDGRLTNREESSQFLVAELSRPSEILRAITDGGREVALFGDAAQVPAGC